MRKWLILLLIVCPVVTGMAQPAAGRYLDPVFQSWTETEEVLFSTAVPQPTPGGGFYELITGLPLNADETETVPVDLYMDIFEPQGDTISRRPVIILCFGGGFLSGSKDHWSMRLLAQEFALRGYVAAIIDYRLGMNIFDQELATRAVYRAIQDGRAAVRFFRADAAGPDLYRADPDRIFIGGHSSGGFISLHNAYLDREIERPLSTYTWIQDGEVIPDLDSLDNVGGNTGFNGHATAVFSLAGALGFTEYIETANDKNVVLFHSTDDGTVPYDSGEPFQDISFLIVGSDLPNVFGSLPVSNRAEDLGLPYAFLSYTDRGHGVHENGDTALYDDILPGICNWFYDQHLKPDGYFLAGNAYVCTDDRIQDYEVNQGDAVYYDWHVDGGTFLFESPDSSAVEIEWDDTSAIHRISVIPYNAIFAAGDTQTLHVTVAPVIENVWIGADGNWTDDTLWSATIAPGPCDSVIIPASDSLIEILVQDSILVRSLEANEQVRLRLQNGTSFRIQKTGSGQ